MVAVDDSLGQSGEKLCWPVEVGHLNVGRAKGIGHMSIAAGTARQPFDGRIHSGLPLQRAEACLGVESLDGIDEPVLDQLVDLVRSEAVTHRIKRMRNVDEATLISNGSGRVEQRHPRSNALAEKEPDELALSDPDLFTNDHTTWQLVPKSFSPGGCVVVGETHHIDGAGRQGINQLFGRCGAIARPHRVRVHVDPHETVSTILRQVRVPLDGRW